MKHISRLFFLLFSLSLIVMLISVVMVVPVSAISLHTSPTVLQIVPQQTAPAAPMDLTGFLQWLVGGGGSILAVSWILERLKWFQSLSSNTKDYTIFGFAVFVGCGALAVITYVPPAILALFAPYFLILASTFVMVFIAKAFHRADKVG
jgi:hypothetical protein